MKTIGSSCDESCDEMGEEKGGPSREVTFKLRLQQHGESGQRVLQAERAAATEAAGDMQGQGVRTRLGEGLTGGH